MHLVRNAKIGDLKKWVFLLRQANGKFKYFLFQRVVDDAFVNL